MKKNIALRLASGLMLSCLLSTCVISGTFAKYTTSNNAEDSARVAKWDIELNDTKITTNTFTFDLFNTINDTDGNPEADVDTNLIAPGTQGSFKIKLENLSEVTAEYTIDYTVTNTANIPVQFSVDGTNWSATLADVTKAVTLAKANGTETITIQWKWEFERGTTDGEKKNNNQTDTNLGLTMPTLTVEAKVTVTQVD